ncbi:MAG: dicarboxylate/amino acid:cation symporter [Bacteroidales bacterium]|nr:dicarboxylate/amino acid:cation symporter [Bacteroidales bacterium]
MKKVALHWQILIGILLAIVFGYFFPRATPYVGWMGTLFMRALKMIVVPLVFSSLISGVTRAGSGKSLGRLGFKTFLYYLSTSLLAILTGLFLVNLIQPGLALEGKVGSLPTMPDLPGKKLDDTLIEIVPENFFHSLTLNEAMLSVIFFALLTGIFITRLRTDQKNLLTDFFNAFFELMMKITLFIIRLAPFGIFGLVAVMVAEQEISRELFNSLGKYMLTVVAGLLFHLLITLPLILHFIGKVNPFAHYKAMAMPLITAFTTASSNATLPITIEAVEEKAGVSNKVSGFTLPMGATINMDGTALYELVVAGFVAQLYGHQLGFGEQFILVATALLASIGTAAVPMASLVTMSIIFTAVGLPFEAVALVLVVDRPLDMLRTATNVFSDTCGAVTIASSEGEELLVSRQVLTRS